LSLWLAAPLCVCGALVVAWLFELSTERVLLLAPVIVFGTGAVVGLLLLWTKMALGSIRRPGADARSGRPETEVPGRPR
jgi:hypothetical protein